MKAKKSTVSRVYWTSDEGQNVIARYAELRRLHPGLTSRDAIGAAQDMLPADRRRPTHPPLISWANKAWKEYEAERARRPAPQPEPAPEPAQERETPVSLTQLSDDEIASGIIAYGIRAGATVLKGILRDPEVQAAIASLIADSVRQLGPVRTSDNGSDVSDASEPPSVLILGLSEQQSTEFARAYRSLMQMRFDRGASVSASLREALALSTVVIAMDGSVSQEVSRLLHSLAPDYIRHTNGLAGLRSRLADLAMRAAPSSFGATSVGTTGKRHS